MTQEHPINPPPELVKQWIKECDQPDNPRWQEYEQDIATRAAQWGADTELEGCCEWLSVPCPSYGRELRNARRPKTPSLKEQAQAELKRLIALIPTEGAIAMAEPIRRALEQLDD
jgi:hypothetical protein